MPETATSRLGQIHGLLAAKRYSVTEIGEDVLKIEDVDSKISLRAVLEGSTELLEKQSQHILGLREAWLEVRRQHPLPDPRPGSPSTAPPPDGDQDNGQPQRGSKWKA